MGTVSMDWRRSLERAVTRNATPPSLNSSHATCDTGWCNWYSVFLPYKFEMTQSHKPGIKIHQQSYHHGPRSIPRCLMTNIVPNLLSRFSESFPGPLWLPRQHPCGLPSASLLPVSFGPAPKEMPTSAKLKKDYSSTHIGRLPSSHTSLQ
jgi:hypothetical protein